MATRGKVTELAGELRKNLPTLTKPRLDLILLFILSATKVGTINLSKIALALDTKVKKDSNYRRLQRLLDQVKLINAGLPLLLLKLAGLTDNLTLLIDRTNWEFGKKKINILMISVLYNQVSIPLIWVLLNKKGNSSQGERWDLLNRLIDKIGPGKISTIIGDREFGGIYWLKYLEDLGITYIIRVKENQVVGHKNKRIKVKSLVEKNNRKNRQCSSTSYEFGGNQVFVGGFRFRNDKGKLEYLIIFSNQYIADVGAEYGKRWQIESMFKNMKSNGFNLRDTHLSKDSRIENLVGLIAIAYVWMIKVGHMLVKHCPKIFKVKKHGRPTKSIFKAGYDFVARALFTGNTRDLRLIYKFLSCT